MIGAKFNGDMLAYPHNQLDADGCSEASYPGVTKREAMAVAAMQGMLANSYHSSRSMPLSEANREEIAQMAVGQADALLRALEAES